jgi:multiple sugar transport system permease protein
MTTTQALARRHVRPGLSLARREARAFYFMISPWLFGFLAFTAGPILASFFFSLTQYDVVRPPVFRGLENYARMLGDPLIAKSLENTVYYAAISIPLSIVFSLLLAVLLNQKAWGNAAYRTAFYLPSIVPVVANAVLWIWLLQPQWGLVNYLLGLVGIKGPAWLASITWAKPALIMMAVWSSGTAMVIFLAGLQGIPEPFYEAASIDGANSVQKFFRITIPLLTPTIFFQIVMGIIGSFQVFTTAYIMTNGGPVNATLFFVLYLYRQAFVHLNMGYAAAMAWLLFLIVLALTIVQLRLAPRWVHYEV